jgi:acyl carrier protein
LETTLVDTLTGIISEALRIEESKVTPELAIHQSDAWNSLTHIELIVMIEDRFQIQLTEDEIVAMTTVSKIREVVLGRDRDVRPEA